MFAKIIIGASLLLSNLCFAAVPFESYFGHYKVNSCEYTVNGNSLAADPECNYSRIEIGKDARGVVRVTRLTPGGSSVGEPVEIFNRQQDGFKDVATFSIYGNFQLWQHVFSRPGSGFEQIIEVTDFIFDALPNNRFSFSIGKNTQKKSGSFTSRRTFYLTRE